MSNKPVRMKAYQVTFTAEGLSCLKAQDLVFANTVIEAKAKFLDWKSVFAGAIECSDKNKIKIARRPELDGCEKLPKVAIAEKLVTKCGWNWTFFNGGGDDVTPETFDKNEFEKAWARDEVQVNESR